MTLTLYGITTCDTVRKARAWLDQHAIAYRFHDFRKDGITRADVERWADAVGWEKLLNKSSTTWRDLPQARKDAIDHDSALALMTEAPTVIKRPVIEDAAGISNGFKPAAYAERFGIAT